VTISRDNPPFTFLAAKYRFAEGGEARPAEIARLV